MVDVGLLEVPEHYVQPPNERIDKKLHAITHDNPPIDFSNLDDQVVDQAFRDAETLGFFQVLTHGVPVDLLESLTHATNNVFGYRERKVYGKPIGTSFVPEKEKGFEWKDCISILYITNAEALEYLP